MVKYRPFSGVLYAEDFDAPEPVIAREPVPVVSEPIVVEPTFSLADLHRAAERAQQEARAQERLEFEHRLATRQTDALARIADALEHAHTEAGRLAAVAATATADTLLAMVAAVLPAFAATRGADEARALLGELVPAMTHQPRLVIRAHPELVELLEPEMGAVRRDEQPAIEWLPVADMLPGDLAVRWQDGSMIRDTRALCARVQALVTQEFILMPKIEETPDGQRD